MSSKARRSSFSTASRVTFTRSVEAANGYTWRQNVAIPTATLGTASGGTGTYAISSIAPALPAGLTAAFSGSTLQITGTPTGAGSSTLHTVIVTDTSHDVPDSMTTVELRISTVVASLNNPVQQWTQNVAIAPFIPVLGTGGLPPYTYSIAPVLPTGLSISSSTGTISGTPTVASAAATYTVTVTDSFGGTGGSAVNSFSASVVASGPLWVSALPNLSYTQGSGIQTYALAQNTTGFNSQVYQFQVTPPPSQQLVTGVTLAPSTGVVTIDTTNIISVSGVTYDIVPIVNTALADFTSRAAPAIAAGGWAQRFTSSADVDNFRFTNGVGWDQNPAAGTVGSFVRWLSTGGVIPGDGCMELEQQTNGNMASYWTRPFDPTITHQLNTWPIPMTGIRGPGQEFCLQVRFKTNCGNGGGAAGQGINNGGNQGGRKMFSLTRPERSNVDPGQVTQDTGYRGVFQMYMEHNFVPYEEGVPGSASSDITLQPGSQYNETGGPGYCSYQGLNVGDRTDCWRLDYNYPNWQTYLFHVIPSSNGVANGTMEVFAWTPGVGLSNYVRIEQKLNFTHFYGEAGLTPDGFGAFIAWIYETNRASGPANQKQWYDQIIFYPGASTIPVPTS